MCIKIKTQLDCNVLILPVSSPNRLRDMLSGQYTRFFLQSVDNAIALWQPHICKSIDEVIKYHILL